jgi:hypothetical protein
MHTRDFRLAAVTRFVAVERYNQSHQPTPTPPSTGFRRGPDGPPRQQGQEKRLSGAGSAGARAEER